MTSGSMCSGHVVPLAVGSLVAASLFGQSPALAQSDIDIDRVSDTPCVCDAAICEVTGGKSDPEANRHEGFLLRITGGFGYMYGSGEPEAVLDGMAGGFGFSGGSMIVENFGLHLDVFLINAFRSELSIDGSVDETYNALFQVSSMGLGASYYLMPSNLYATVSVGAGTLYTTAYAQVDDSFALTGSESSRFGPALALGIGKEWWASPSWGLGMAAMYNFLSVNGEDAGELTVDSIHHFGVRFSATYN